jgi:transposase-like protein
MEVIVLSNIKFSTELTFFVDRLDSDRITLADSTNPYLKLTISKQGTVVFKAGVPSRDNIFFLEKVNAEAGFLIRSYSPVKVTQGSSYEIYFIPI